MFMHQHGSNSKEETSKVVVVHVHIVLWSRGLWFRDANAPIYIPLHFARRYPSTRIPRLTHTSTAPSQTSLSSTHARHTVSFMSLQCVPILHKSITDVATLTRHTSLQWSWHLCLRSPHKLRRHNMTVDNAKIGVNFDTKRYRRLPMWGRDHLATQ